MLANTMQLRRSQLIGTRAIWIVSVCTTLLYLVAGLPRLLIDYGLPCGEDLHPTPSCIVVETGLRSLSLDWSFYAWYSVIWITAVSVLGFVLCFLLAWRKNGEPQMLLFSVAILLGVIANINYDLPDIVAESYPVARVIVFILTYLGQISLMLFYVFPDGHFVPGWIRWVAAVIALLDLAAKILYWWALPFVGWPNNLLSIILWVIFPLTLAYALFYRYRKTANLEQRQQIKWIMWAVSLATLLFAADVMVDFVGSWLGWDVAMPIWYSVHQALVSPTIDYVGVLLISLGFYVAIFRFRLWNVDLFINRSLVYGGLTVLLGSVLVGAFVATQALLAVMVEDMQVGAAGIVALIVAIALFVPARDRLQRFVDRRVYGVDPNHERAVQIAIAQERDRLSCELHDSVAQSLYGLSIMAESCQRLAHQSEAKNLEEPLVEMVDVARQALKEMRLLIHELRPSALEEEGLISALYQRLAEVEKRSGIEVKLMIEDRVNLPVAVEESLYHIAVEALNNAIKHASATSVSISYRTVDAWVELEIADDGKGFKPGSADSKGGIGLVSMRKRAEKLGGTLTVDSQPGQGVKVTVRLSHQPDPQKHRKEVVS